MKRPLIVYIDTSGVALAEDIARAAKAWGVRTGVICPPRALPKKGHPFAFVRETKDFSLPALRAQLAAIDARYRIRGIASCFGAFRSDGFLHESVATLAAERGLPHSPPEALAAATNKFLQRFKFGLAGLPDIPFGLAQDAPSLIGIANRIGYPVILKPLTGVGSSLIYRCDSEEHARRQWARARRALKRAFYDPLKMAPHSVAMAHGAVFHFDPQRMMLVERYIPGREASVECLVSGGKVYPLVVHDKLDVEEKTGVVLEHLLVAPPTRFSAAEAKALRAHAVAAIKALGLRDMLCHVELRWLDGAGPRILEVNPRVGAACVADSIETFTTLKPDAARAALILGRKIRAPRRRRAARHAMIFLFTDKTGTLRRLDGLNKAQRLPEVEVMRQMHFAGDRVGGDLEEGFVAGFWLTAANAREARRSYEDVRSLVTIDVV